MSRTPDGRPEGFLLIDKPRGLTSHDVVKCVRRRLAVRQVGHSGTLDPMATGLLVLGVGRATRLLRFVESQRKSYRASVVLGVATSTEDAEGTVVERTKVEVGLTAVREAAAGLVGAIEQRVPAYSAVRVDGERLHRRVRRGESVERPVRRVRVHRFEVLGLLQAEPGLAEVDIDVEVSKGTYVRTLGVELGRRLGAPAHLAALRRTSVGLHRVEAATNLDDVGPEAVVEMAVGLAGMPAWTLDANSAASVLHGRPLTAPVVRRHLKEAAGTLTAESREPRDGPGLDEPMGPVALLDASGTVLAVGEVTLGINPSCDAPAKDGAFRYLCVLGSPEGVSS
ncbi:MAG: tRNA pseudouridine(55) synthase TruB [Myxococcota bacterium]